MEGKKVSIVDVAKTAGVSTATVSRVVNQLGGYSKETEKKVLHTIKECGFRPNVNAIGLRTRRSHSVGNPVNHVAVLLCGKFCIFKVIIFFVHGLSSYLSSWKGPPFLAGGSQFSFPCFVSLRSMAVIDRFSFRSASNSSMTSIRPASCSGVRGCFRI